MKIKNAVVAGMLALMLGNAQATLVAVAGYSHVIYDDKNDNDQSTGQYWYTDIKAFQNLNLAQQDAQMLDLFGALLEYQKIALEEIRRAKVEETLQMLGSVPLDQLKTFFTPTYESQKDGIDYFSIRGSALRCNFGVCSVQEVRAQHVSFAGDSSYPAFHRDDIIVDDWNIQTDPTGEVGAWFTADAITQPQQPIPEPETYAMLLAGLGLLGAMARRRKQKLHA